MRVLVTGGAGFIGSHVVDLLVERGHAVIVLDSLDPQVHGQTELDEAGVPESLEAHAGAGQVGLVHGDIRDAAAVERALDGVSAVVHLAAAVGVGQSMYVPRYYTSVNVDGQGALMEAMARDASRFERLVVASSMSIYGEGAYHCEAHGDVAPPPRPLAQLAAGAWEVRCPQCGDVARPALTAESKPLQPTSIYAITKKTQEELALCFGAAYGVPTVALRFFNVYGSRQALSNPYTGVAAIFLARLKNGRRPLVFEDGAQTRDFIHVSDVARAVLAALEAPTEATGAYNICTGRPLAVAELAERLATSLGVRVEPQLDDRYRAGDIRHCVGDPAAARRVLGFDAQMGIDEGLDELIAWAQRTDAVDRVEQAMRELEERGLVR
ncbi:MAG: NAD-dependent epimerase/dehydratase family protein [Longimicrobiales bacterium]